MNINEIIEARLTHNKEALTSVMKGILKVKNELAKEPYRELKVSLETRISELEALKFNIEQECKTKTQ